MFGSTDDDANVAQAVAVQQQSERIALTEFGDEFDDFSTPSSADILKKMRLDAGQSLHPPTKKQKIVEESEKVSSRVAKSERQSDKLSKDKNLTGPSIDRSERRVSLDKDKVVPNVEMRDADKASAASEEKLSLSKSDLDEIKSYVRTYVPVCKTNLKYVRKLSSKRNRQPSKVYQSPFVNVFDSESKDKEVIQSHKKLKYPFEGHNINGPYAKDLFSKFSIWMSAGLYNSHTTK
ncbi:hypothetical protein T459_03844 [Capsicum annuum]|uniref:Uncharacterized protein n=1 Tax=Capsicum annuum TaxID=4072 RepID=A0A2G3ANZ8_CAPAN|nr:hypothetical protein T459_03844 [Capsicum annuum]